MATPIISIANLELMIQECKDETQLFASDNISTLEPMYNYVGILTVLFYDLVYDLSYYQDIIQMGLTIEEDSVKEKIKEDIQKIEKDLMEYNCIKYGSLTPSNTEWKKNPALDKQGNDLELSEKPKENSKLWVVSKYNTHLPDITGELSGQQLEDILKLYVECLCKTKLLYGLYQHYTIASDSQIVWTSILDIDSTGVFIKNLPIEHLSRVNVTLFNQFEQDFANIFPIVNGVSVSVLKKVQDKLKETKEEVDRKERNRVAKLIAAARPEATTDTVQPLLVPVTEEPEPSSEDTSATTVAATSAVTSNIDTDIIMVWMYLMKEIIINQPFEKTVGFLTTNSEYYKRNIKSSNFNYELITTFTDFQELFNKNVQLILLLYKTLITFTKQLFITNNGITNMLMNNEYETLIDFIDAIKKDGITEGLTDSSDTTIPYLDSFDFETLYNSEIFKYFAIQLRELINELFTNLIELTDNGVKNIYEKFKSIEILEHFKYLKNLQHFHYTYGLEDFPIDQMVLALETSKNVNMYKVINTFIHLPETFDIYEAANNKYYLDDPTDTRIPYDTILKEISVKFEELDTFTPLKIIPLNVETFYDLLQEVKPQNSLNAILEETVMLNGWLQLRNSYLSTDKPSDTDKLLHVIEQQKEALLLVKQSVVKLKEDLTPAAIDKVEKDKRDLQLAEFERLKIKLKKVTEQHQILETKNKNLEKINSEYEQKLRAQEKHLDDMKRSVTTAEQYKLGLGLHN